MRLRHIGRVHRASLLGLSAIGELSNLPTQETQELARRAIGNIADSSVADSIADAAASVNLRRDYLLLNANALVSLWSALEVTIEDFLIAWMMNQRGALSVPDLRKVKISLAEYDMLDPEERMRVLLNELERNVIGKQGVDCFEPLLETFGLSGPVDKPTKAAIYKMQHVRNVVVHRGGHADRRFVKGCPDWSVKVGEPLKVKAKQCSDYERAVARYVLTVAERVAARLGAMDSRELAKLQSLLRR